MAGYQFTRKNAKKTTHHHMIGFSPPAQKQGNIMNSTPNSDISAFWVAIIRSVTYMALIRSLKSRTWVPNRRYPSWAKAKKMIINMTMKPARSFLALPMVVVSWVIVLLKLTYLKTCRKEQQGTEVGRDGIVHKANTSKNTGTHVIIYRQRCTCISGRILVHTG